jgi:hypothetical protein
MPQTHAFLARVAVAVLVPALTAAVSAQTDGSGWLFNGSSLFYTGGNVGIGTSMPVVPLHVIGGAPASIVGATTTPTGVSIGVWGQSSSTNGRGVYGFTTAPTGGAIAGLFRTLSNQGVGVYALSDAASGATTGIRGQAASPDGTAVYGLATSASGQTNGVFGKALSDQGAGVSGMAASTMGVNYGVYGETASLTDGFGVYCVGDTAATGLKLFQIDHPLDPARRLLNHFSVEGPEPYLEYRGTAVCDEHGAAVVQLPAYFEAINRDPHYQLTPIGGPAMVYVAEEVQNNRFVIGGGRPGMKVCWTVTGIRNDRFVQRYGAAAEVQKTPEQRGRYLHPELFGLPPSSALRPAPLATDAQADAPQP